MCEYFVVAEMIPVEFRVHRCKSLKEAEKKYDKYVKAIDQGEKI